VSNPAVITLDEVKGKRNVFKRFTIEDNIGEAMHLHIDNMRIDFTIDEFLEFSQMIKESLKELDFLDGYSIESFDEQFLKECADYLPNLIEIKKEKIKLKNLLAISHFTFKDLILQKIIPLDETPSFKFLQGDEKFFVDYPQFNYFGVSNEQRLLDLKISIEQNGYPYNEQYIILFNEQNFIRDGQHRAVVLVELFGLNYEIEVLRFYFKGKNHLIKATESNFKKMFIWFLKKLYSKLKNYIAN